MVLIATDDPASSAVIAQQLERSGFDTRIAVYDGRTLKDAPRRAPKAVLVYFKDFLHTAAQVLTTLRARYNSYDLTFIGAFPRKGVIDADLFDSVIFPPAHPVQIARACHINDAASKDGTRNYAPDRYAQRRFRH